MDDDNVVITRAEYHQLKSQGSGHAKLSAKMARYEGAYKGLFRRYQKVCLQHRMMHRFLKTVENSTRSSADETMRMLYGFAGDTLRECKYLKDDELIQGDGTIKLSARKEKRLTNRHAPKPLDSHKGGHLTDDDFIKQIETGDQKAGER